MEEILNNIKQIKERVNNGTIQTKNGTDHYLLKQLERMEALVINFAHSSTQFNASFEKGDKVLIDGCLDAEIILKNEQTYRVKYIDDGDFGDVPTKGIEPKSV